MSKPELDLRRASEARQDEAGGARGRRALHDAMLVAVGVEMLALVFWFAQTAASMHSQGSIGVDLAIYTSAARRWLAGGGWFLPGQLAGPYLVSIPDVLYPPLWLWVLVPFVVLPGFLWWALPLAIVGYALRKLRPPLWAWLVMFGGLAWPRTPVLILAGNPVIWVVALTFLATVLGAGGAFVWLKPSLFPFALLGANHRRWWAVIIVLGFCSLPVLREMLEYPLVLLNARGGGAFYSLGDVPLMLVPAAAWLAQRGQRAALKSTTTAVNGAAQ